jgi:hypothetical protein
MYFVTHPVLKLDPASRFGPALGTAIDGFIQIVFFGRLQRDSRHHDSTVRTGHKPDGTAGTTVPVALGLGTFCQRHALLRNQTTRQERVICSQKAVPCARGRATWHAGGSCGQMLGVKEQPDKRWLISVGHAVLCAGLWPGHGTRLTSPQKPQGGAVLRAAHGEVGCLPVPPGLQWRMSVQKITFGEMRAAGVLGLLIYCSDFRRSHWTAISGGRWPDGVRRSDIERRLTRQSCSAAARSPAPGCGRVHHQAAQGRTRRRTLADRDGGAAGGRGTWRTDDSTSQLGRDR